MELKGGFTRLNLLTTSPNQGTNESAKFGQPNTDVNSQISGLATIQLTGFVGTGSDFTLGDEPIRTHPGHQQRFPGTGFTDLD